MIESYVRNRLATRDILLMTHIVLGFPDFETSLKLIETMVDAGVDLVELQIPFSEPIADGPVILKANQEALTKGATVDRCFELAAKVARRFEVPFLFMSYYNILFRRGVSGFVASMKEAGLRGAIVPDLPPEEGGEYLAAAAANGIDPVFIYSPNTPSDRLATIATFGRGFIYCVARKGVTGSETTFADDLSSYLARARASTSLPLAVGFGVKERRDVEFLRGRADIAVVGSETLRALERGGLEAVRGFLGSLREAG